MAQLHEPGPSSASNTTDDAPADPTTATAAQRQQDGASSSGTGKASTRLDDDPARVAEATAEAAEAAAATTPTMPYTPPSPQSPLTAGQSHQASSTSNTNSNGVGLGLGLRIRSPAWYEGAPTSSAALSGSALATSQDGGSPHPSLLVGGGGGGSSILHPPPSVHTHLSLNLGLGLSPPPGAMVSARKGRRSSASSRASLGPAPGPGAGGAPTLHRRPSQAGSASGAGAGAGAGSGSIIPPSPSVTILSVGGSATGSGSGTGTGSGSGSGDAAPSTINGGSGAGIGIGGGGPRRSSGTSNTRRSNILGSANSALAGYASPSPPPAALAASAGAGAGANTGVGTSAGTRSSLLASPAGTASLHGTPATGMGWATATGMGSAGASPGMSMPMPRGRSISSYTSTSSVGGSVGHGLVLANAAHGYPDSAARARSYDDEGAYPYLGSPHSGFLMGLGGRVAGTGSVHGSSPSPRTSESLRRSLSQRAQSSSSRMADAQLGVRSRSRSPGARFGAGIGLGAGGGLGVGVGVGISGVAGLGGAPASPSPTGPVARSSTRHRLSLPDHGSMAGFRSSSSLSLSLSAASNPSTPLTPHFVHHADIGMGIGGGSGDMISPPPPTPGYFQSQFSPAQHSPWFNNTSPHTQNVGSMGPGGSLGGVGVGVGGGMRSPFASASSQVGRLQPIPATAPPSDDGHSSGEGPGAGAGAGAGSGLGLGLEGRQAEVGEGSRVPSDSVDTVDQGASGGASSSARRAGSHGLEGSSGSGASTEPGSSRSATGKAEGAEPTAEPSRTTSPGGGPTSSSKARRRGRKALTDKLKRRSKRVSAHGAQQPASRPGSGAYLDDERRWSQVRDGGEDGEGGSEGEETYGLEEQEADESDTGFEEGVGGGGGGASTHVREQWREDLGDTDRDDSDGDHNDGAATATATATTAEPSSRPTSTRHRAFTSPVHKLASASASTLDFGSQLGLQPGEPSSRPTSLVSVGTAGSPVGLGVGAGSGGGGGGGKRIVTPTSPILGPTSPAMPHVGPVSTATATGLFLSSGLGARRLGQGGTSERDGASPGPDGASITSQSRTATNSSTTPRLHLATLSSDDASQRAGPTPGPSDRGTDSSRSSEEDATTPAPHSRPTSALQRSESRTSGLGAGDEDDTFFDASDAGPMLSLSPSPIPIPRSGSGSDLVVSESVVSEEGGRSVVVPHEAARARSSTVVAPSAPRAAAAAAAAAAGEAPPLPASGSADSGLSVPSSTSTSTNASDHSSAGTGDDSLVGSFDESSSSARAGHNSGATEPSSEASRGSSSGGSGGTSGLQEQPKDVQAGTGTGEDVVLTHPASPTDDVFRGALLGGRAGDPVSTATLRQDASEQAKLEASPAAQGQAHASAPAQTQGHARVQGQGHGQAPAPIVSTVPAAYTLPTLIRTRTGSILPMARELPRTPPPLAPIQTGNVARAGGAPLVIESPATPNTPALAAFVGPMQISTAMPSPDLHMVEPQSFHLRAVPEPSAFQLDARGRPRGASVGALSGNHAPLRPSSLAASASSLAPLKQSPGPEERKMALWHEEAAGEQSGSSDAHRRSESYGTGAGDSSSHHHHHNNNIGGAGADLTQHGGGGGGGQSGGPGAGREHHSAISAGVSDRTTNTSHSRSVHSLAATDVSSSDTSLSAPEGEVDIEGGGGGGGGGGEESGKAVEVLRTPSSLLAHAGASQPAPLAASTAASADARTGASATSQSKERSLTFQHPEQERLPSTGAVEAGGLVSAMKNRARARSLGVASHSLSASSTLTGLSPASAAAGAGGGGPAGAMGAANPAVLAGVAAASASASASAQGATSSGGRSRSGSSASLQRQAQLPLRSPASFVLAVVGHRGAGKSTVIRKGLRQYGLSKPNLLSEKVSSYSTFCLVDNAERTIEVLEIDAAVLLNNPTKRFAWPKFLPSIDAVILCYDASEVSSFRSMSELLENFSVHGVRTVMLACKSDVEPKALNPYYASEMAAMYNVGLAECTSHTEEGRKRMRNCFSYLVKGVAKARAGRGVGSRTTASRQASQLTGTDSDAASPSTATAQQLRLSSGSTAEMGRARGNSVPNVRFSTNRSSGAAAVAESVYEEMNGDCPTARQDPHHTCSARCVSRKMSSATHESEPLSMSASEEEGSSDHRHRSMIHNAQLGLQSAKLAGGYLSLDELYDRFFYSAVSKIDPTFATTFMVFYRGFAQPIDLLMQAITRFEVLTHQEKFDEEVIRFSLIRMATMLREWVQDYPGDLSGSDTFPVLMNFYNRLLQHRDCADVVKAAEGSFAAVAGAVDLDAAWSARLNSHKPSSVAADHPPINMEGAPGSALAAPASMSALDQSGGSDGLLGLSIDPSFGNQGRSRADSGSIVASPASLVEPQTAAGSATETGRLTAQAVAGRDRSLSSATTASSDRQASVTSTDSATLVRASSISSSVPSKVTTLSYDSASAKAQLRAASDALFEIEDAKIAHELTVMAWSIFMNIKPRDLLRHALVPIDQRPDGPCMQEIRHFNYVSAWIVNMILAQSKLKNRSRLLEKFMNVAVLIRGENDYATLYCIIGALESQAVYRLGNTWHAIAEKPVLKQYQSLTKLMSPTKSYAAYRMAIQNSSGRTIPHLGVIYQDLVSLSAGNPSRTQVEGTVHWRMFELIDAHVSHFIACQQFSDSVGASDPALRKHIMDLPVSQVEDETLMERSKTLEPTARVRRTDEAWMSALSRKGKKLFASASLSQAT